MQERDGLRKGSDTVVLQHKRQLEVSKSTCTVKCYPINDSIIELIMHIGKSLPNEPRRGITIIPKKF